MGHPQTLEAASALTRASWTLRAYMWGVGMFLAACTLGWFCLRLQRLGGSVPVLVFGWATLTCWLRSRHYRHLLAHDAAIRRVLNH